MASEAIMAKLRNGSFFVDFTIRHSSLYILVFGV